MLSPADTDAASELLPVQRRRLRVEILSPWLRASLSWRSARLGARGRRGNGEGDVTAGYLLLVPLSRSVCACDVLCWLRSWAGCVVFMSFFSSTLCAGYLWSVDVDVDVVWLRPSPSSR
jgi:hypothetical protein